jgi:hypothetical protein
VRYKVEGGTLNDMTNFYTYKPSSANHHLDQAKRHKAEGVKVAVSNFKTEQIKVNIVQTSTVAKSEPLQASFTIEINI